MPSRTGLLELASWNRNGPDGDMAFCSLAPSEHVGKVEKLRTTQHMNLLRSIAKGSANSHGLGSAVASLVTDRKRVAGPTPSMLHSWSGATDKRRHVPVGRGEETHRSPYLTIFQNKARMLVEEAHKRHQAGASSGLFSQNRSSLLQGPAWRQKERGKDRDRKAPVPRARTMPAGALQEISKSQEECQEARPTPSHEGRQGSKKNRKLTRKRASSGDSEDADNDDKSEEDDERLEPRSGTELWALLRTERIMKKIAALAAQMRKEQGLLPRKTRIVRAQRDPSALERVPSAPTLEEGKDLDSQSPSGSEVEDYRGTSEQQSELSRPPSLKEGVDISDEVQAKAGARPRRKAVEVSSGVSSTLVKWTQEVYGRMEMRPKREVTGSLMTRFAPPGLTQTLGEVQAADSKNVHVGRAQTANLEAAGPGGMRAGGGGQSAIGGRGGRGKAAAEKGEGAAVADKGGSVVIDEHAITRTASQFSESKDSQGNHTATRSRANCRKSVLDGSAGFYGLKGVETRGGASRFHARPQEQRISKPGHANHQKACPLPFAVISWSSQKLKERSAATNLANLENRQTGQAAEAVWETDGPPEHYLYLDLGDELVVTGIQLRCTGTQLDPKSLTLMRGGHGVEEVVEEHRARMMHSRSKKTAEPISGDSLSQATWIVQRRASLKSGHSGREKTFHKLMFPPARARYWRIIFHETWSPNGSMILLSPLVVLGHPDSSRRGMERQESLSTIFLEAVNLDEEERETRGLARKYGISIDYAEFVRKEFNRFDTGCKGSLNYADFSCVVQILTLRKASVTRTRAEVSENRMRTLWQNVDTDGSGAVEFGEFLIWFHQNFNHSDKNAFQSFHSDKMADSATEHFYASMGRNRLSSWLAQQAKEAQPEQEKEEEEREEELPEERSSSESKTTLGLLSKMSKTVLQRARLNRMSRVREAKGKAQDNVRKMANIVTEKRLRGSII